MRTAAISSRNGVPLFESVATVTSNVCTAVLPDWSVTVTVICEVPLSSAREEKVSVPVSSSEV